MPFGKYKGVAMANVPDDYLRYLWCHNVLSFRDGRLKGDLHRVMEYIDMYMDVNLF